MLQDQHTQAEQIDLKNFNDKSWTTIKVTKDTWCSFQALWKQQYTYMYETTFSVGEPPI
jgi:hypothetical protein